KLWRNLRQSRHPTTDADRRLVALWRWQAFGLLLAGVPIAVVWLLWARQQGEARRLANARVPIAVDWLLMSFPSRFDVPFWTVYAVVITVGAGALVFAHAKSLEARVTTTRARDERRAKQ